MDDSRIHELLNLNWGGPGFAAYDGRMEDTDGAPMDSQDRTEAALAAFSGTGEDEGTEREEQQRREAGAGQGAAPGEGQRPGAGEGAAEQPAEGQLTDEQRAADPVFKELNEFKTAIGEVFDKHGLVAAAEANGRTPHEEADLQLTDASVLYAIMRGEATPAQLLDAMAQNANWQKPQKDAVAGNLISWLTKAGYLKEGQAAAQPGAATGKDGKPALVDPLEERIKNIETAQEKRDREQKESAVQAEKDRVGKVFVDHVTKLCTDTGIPKEDIAFYMSQVAAMVNGNKAITDRVGKGNFVDIKKFFDTVHNRELKRLERFNKAQLERQKGKERNPKSSAGGGPAAPAGPAKRNVANRDDRLAAAAEMLTSG